MSDHKAEDLKGRLKEAVGDVTGDKSLKREGRVDRASAAAKRAVDKTAEAVSKVVNPKK